MPNKPMPDEEITIVQKYETLTVVQGRAKRSRLEWQGGGLSVYVKGSLEGSLYWSACNLATNAAIARHIPAIALRKVSK